MGIFENRTNTSLYLENSEDIQVIVGQYGELDKSPTDSPLEREIHSTSMIRVDDDQFYFESIEVPLTGIGTLSLPVGSQILSGIGTLFTTELGINATIILEDSVTSIREEFVVADITNDTELEVTAISQNAISFIDADGFRIDQNTEIPDWIHSRAIVTFIDTNSILYPGLEQYANTYPRTISYVSYETGNQGFTIDYRLPIEITEYTIQKVLDLSTIGESQTSKDNDGINDTGHVEKNILGGTITIPYNEVNNGEFLRCIEITSASLRGDGYGLLLYDKFAEQKNGTASFINNIITGQNTNFLNDFKPGDIIFIGNNPNNIDDTTIYTIEAVEHDARMRTVETTLVGIAGNVYRTSTIFEDVESIIYDTYDNSREDSQGNFKNIMPLRGDRKIFYKYGAQENTLRNTKGNVFNFEKSMIDRKIYKLWVNGELLNSSAYALDINAKTIIILDDKKVRTFNNYCYFIDYDISTYNNPGDPNDGHSNANGLLGDLVPGDLNDRRYPGEYAVFTYNGYKDNFITSADYFFSLPNFLYYMNFSESMSYDYYDYEDRRVDRTKRKKTNKKHRLTFSSYVIEDSACGDLPDQTNAITWGLSSKLSKIRDFRVLRYNRDTGSIVVYNQCEFNVPESEAIGDDANMVTFTFDFRDKIILTNRLQGDGDWGQFKLFGLNVIGIY